MVLKTADQVRLSLVMDHPVKSEAAFDNTERKSVYLHPGKIFASSEPCNVKTILGSCVAVCLCDLVQRVGGVAHFLLPYWAGNGQSASGGSAKFGNIAIRFLIERVLALGSTRHNLQAKLFGGACVLEAMRISVNHLGAKNVELARKLLEEEKIPIISENVEGQRGRKLIFQVDSGNAWVKLL